MSTVVAADPKQGTLFGHPTGLFTLFFAEMWERFSYYGMRALLIFYITKGFLGYGDRAAYLVYGAYVALVYATPFIGGLLADRLLGPRRSVVIGGLLMAAGHLLMGIENDTAFFTALALLIVGNGFFKPNISTIVGGLYPPGSHKKDGGFTLFYIGINLGAAMSPLLCGYIGETYGWHYGFGLATIGMVLGLAVFVMPTRLSQALIALGALGAALGLFVLRPDNFWSATINIFVAATLVIAGVIAVMALNRGGLPGAAGRPPKPGRLSEPAFPRIKVLGWLSASNAVYLGILIAIPVLALLVQRNTIAGIVLVIFGILAFGSILITALKSDKIVRERLFVVLILMVFSMVFWSFFEQAGSSVSLFTDRNVDRVSEVRTVTADEVGTTIDLTVTQEQLGRTMGDRLITMDVLDELREAKAVAVKWPISEDDVGMGVAEENDEIPASIFQAINPVYIIIFGLLFTMLWAFLDKRGLEPSTPVKFALGILQLGMGFLAFWYGADTASDEGMVWLGWLLLGYLFQTTGELCLSPVGLSMVTKLAPAKLVSTVMGAWFLATAFSGYISGIIAVFTGVGGHSSSDSIFNDFVIGVTAQLQGIAPADVGKEIPPPLETVGVYGDVFYKIAIAAFVAAGMLFLLAPLLKKWMHEETLVGAPEAEAAEAQAESSGG